MTEFIGSRISLISKRDIRYVGTLHEISSENSTVALENVTSYGTEGRRPDEEVLASPDNIYEYIVFRGSDVKDLRIEEAPREVKKPEPPNFPDDPAILGSTRRPPASTALSSKSTRSPDSQVKPPVEQNVSGQQDSQPQAPPSRQQLPPFQQQPYPYQYPPHNQRFGPSGPGGPGGFPPGPPGYGFPGMPYNGPPGWFPPHGFPHHMAPNQFPPPMPIGPTSQQRQQMPNQPTPINHGLTPASLSGPAESSRDAEMKPTATVKLPSSANTPIPRLPAQVGPPPPNESKPDVMSALAPPSNVPEAPQPEKITTKPGRFVPAIPLSPASKKIASTNGTMKPAAAAVDGKTLSGASKSLDEANRDARAAVAAAMAKLPGDKKQVDNTATIDGVAKAISELRTTENSRGARGNRGSRGGQRSGRGRVEVPKTDFDFESANAKFNKHDLVKEAIASGSPVDTPGSGINGDDSENSVSNGANGGELGVSIPVGVSYNRSSSFFDDISSESKDRSEIKDLGQRVGGREFRNEERQKNLETFGQGSVDNYRYGRGRGRGRGYGRGRGRGFDGRGRGRGNVRDRQNSAVVDG